MNSLNIGDFIKCHDKDEMVDVMESLNESGFDSDFVYEKDGEKGYWLKITDYSDEIYKKAFRYCMETFHLFINEIQYEHEDHMIDYQDAKCPEDELGAFRDLAIDLGKLKMVDEVIKFMEGAPKQVQEAEHDDGNTADSPNVS